MRVSDVTHILTDGSADYTDPDGDLFNNYSEWRARTDPFDAASLLKFRNISVITNTGDPTPLIRLEWQSVPGVSYFLVGATNATGPFTTMANQIWADSTNMIWESAINPTERAMFYKVGAE